MPATYFQDVESPKINGADHLVVKLNTGPIRLVLLLQKRTVLAGSIVGITIV
jgi:hypothetical protein